MQSFHGQLDKFAAAIPGVVYQFLVQPDGEWTFLYLSPGVRKIFEVSPDDAYADQAALTQCIVAEDRAAHRASVEQACATLTPWVHEYRIRSASGAIKWVRGEANPERKADGSVLWNGVLVDISERKQADAALQISEMRFRNMLESLPAVAVQGYGEDGTVRYWNLASEKLYGYTVEETVGRNLIELIIPPEMRVDVAAAIRQMFATGQPIPAGEISLMRKDGSRVEVFSSHAYVHVPGQAPEMFCVDIDLSDLKRAQKALRLTRTSVEAASDAMFWVAPDARIVDVNEAACRSLGYSREELLRLKVADIDHCYGAVLWDGHFPELRKKGSAAFETEHRRKDGSTFQVDVVTNHVRFGDDECCCAVVRDISERKIAERKLAESEQRFSQFMDNLPAAAFIKEECGRVLFLNRYLANMLGSPDWLGKTTDELFPPELAEAMDADDRRALAAGFQLSEEQVPDADGQSRFYHTHKFRIQRQGSSPLLGGIAVDISERKRLEDQVRYMAFFDPLTNLPNRRLLFERLGQTLAAKRRSGCNVALMVIDIDHFKSINDAHGHEAGDLLLAELAHRVAGCVREMDTVARLGGDELVAVLGELDREQALAVEQARHVAEKIRDVVSQTAVLISPHSGAGSITLNCTVSIGVAMLVDGDSWQVGVFRQADAAMYEAKAAGRNAIRFFGADATSGSERQSAS